MSDDIDTKYKLFGPGGKGDLKTGVQTSAGSELRLVVSISFRLCACCTTLVACIILQRKRITRKGNPSDPLHSLDVDLAELFQKAFLVVSLFLIRLSRRAISRPLHFSIQVFGLDINSLSQP